MQIKKLLAPVAAVAVAGTLVVAPSTAGAESFRHMIGFAGGTAIKALGSTVQSDLTSASSVDTIATGVKTVNTLATVEVPQVLLAAAVNTSAQTIANPDGGVSVKTVAQTGGVSLFNGAITLKAVTTTNIATVNGDNTVSSNITTEFVGLKIAGVTLPLNLPANFHVTIPNVANVVLNAKFTASGAPGVIMTQGAGLYVSLLKAKGANPIGTEIYLNPTYNAIASVTPQGGPSIGGYAYSSQIFAKVGTLLNVYSGKTAQIVCPIDGTNGAIKTNTTGTVSLPGIAIAGVLTNTTQGVKGDDDTQSYVTMTTKLAGVNLLNGAITADAIQGAAHVETTGPNNSQTTSSTFTSLVNLKIGGNSIPINVSPNTVITLGTLAKIVIRKEVKNANQALVTALEITLLQPFGGMQTGAKIEIGVAAAWIVQAT